MTENHFDQGNEDRRKQENRDRKPSYSSSPIGAPIGAGNTVIVDLSLPVVPGLSPQQQQMPLGLLQVPDVPLQFRLSSPSSVHSFSPDSPSFSSNFSPERTEYRWRHSPTPAIAYSPPDHPPPDHDKLHHVSPQEDLDTSMSWSQTVSSTSEKAVDAQPSEIVTKPKYRFPFTSLTTRNPLKAGTRPGRRGKKMCQRCRVHKRGKAAPCDPPSDDPDGPCIPCRKAGCAEKCLPRTWPNRSPYNIGNVDTAKRIENMLPVLEGRTKRILEEELKGVKRREEEREKEGSHMARGQGQEIVSLREMELEDPWKGMMKVSTASKRSMMSNDTISDSLQSASTSSGQAAKIGQGNYERSAYTAGTLGEIDDVSETLLDRISRVDARYPGFRRRLLQHLDYLEQEYQAGFAPTNGILNGNVQNEAASSKTSCGCSNT